jgi:hypothetical protein
MPAALGAQNPEPPVYSIPFPVEIKRDFAFRAVSNDVEKPSIYE